MSTLLEEIHALIEAPAVERAHVERTLTDGYAHALNLEVNGLRLQKRVEALRGDDSAKELKVLAKQLDGNAGELSTLRTVLAQLRRRIRT
jgi:predicted kinase